MADYSPSADPLPDQKAQVAPPITETVVTETHINGSSDPVLQESDISSKPIANGISPQPEFPPPPDLASQDAPPTVMTEVAPTIVEAPLHTESIPDVTTSVSSTVPPPGDPLPSIISDGPSPGPRPAEPRDSDVVEQRAETVEDLMAADPPVLDVARPEQTVSNLRASPQFPPQAPSEPIPEEIVETETVVTSREGATEVMETQREEIVDSVQQATPPPEVEPAAPTPTPEPSHTVSLKLSTSQEASDESLPVKQEIKETIITSQEPEVPVAPLQQPEDLEMQDAPVTTLKITHDRDEDEEGEPAAKRTKTDDLEDVEMKVTENTDFKVPDAPADPAPLTISTDVVPTSHTAEGAPISQTIENQPTTSAVPATPAPVDFGPVMLEGQHKRLVEGMRNIRKGKHALNFQKPVDPEALGLPTYLTIIKQPMDLSTMEQKLKSKGYNSVEEYVTDFDLMVQNSITFNGPEHPVSQAGMMLRSQLSAQLKKLPKPGEPTPEAPPKKQRTPSASLPTREPKPRDSRMSTGALPSPSIAAPPSVTTPTTTYAPGPDGMPHIRRDSSTADGRPKREIHKPPSRDLPYSSTKPKKKKFQLELRFCQTILDELSRARYNPITYPFKEPVDPVALNIPDYHKVIKKPMDLKTMGEKLNQGQYENAKEFEADFKLMLQNCFKFNPPNNAIFQVGKTLEGEFDTLWANKQAWIQQNDPTSEPQSPEPESESEEEEEEEDDTATRLAEIQKQISELTQQASTLIQQGQAQGSNKKRSSKSGPSKKSSKPGKSSNSKQARKSGSFGGAAAQRPDKKSKSKPKVKKITMAEKQEISNRIGELTPEQISRAAELIKVSLRKIGRADLADRADDDLEFDIEMIPDETLHDLLKLVRGNLGNQAETTTYSAEYSAVKESNTSKPKKNKPMSKQEQEERIRQLQGQLGTFENPSFAEGLSPDQAKDGQESSDDEVDSGSESEEE